jgi:hypothetical protein
MRAAGVKDYKNFAKEILEFLIKKWGLGRIRYEISDVLIRLILNSSFNSSVILFCSQFLSYKRGISK